MPEENFLLVSLKEDEAKQLAQVISNDTSRRILDYLASVKDSTETELARKLGLPISTVHYNINALVKARLVHADEFHYSEKGKEVNHYSLANKYVIIAPKGATQTLRSKLRRILPVALVTAGAAGLLQVFSSFFRGSARTGAVAPQEFTSAARDAAPIMADKAAESVEEAVAAGVQNELAVQATGTGAVQSVLTSNFALWFLYGAIFAIIVFVVVDWIQRRK